jgi:membrane protease subunit (stomatin/prohibitin family)
MVGTKGYSNGDEIVSWLKSIIVTQLNDALGELKSKKQLSVVDMPAYLDEIGQMLLSKVETNVTEYGIKIMRIGELNINLPEEVQKAIDTRSGIGALGLTDQKQKEAYLAFQAGGAMRDAAKQEGGAAGAGAGAGVGLGAGMGMGMMMASQLGQTMQPQQPQQARPNGVKCPSCGADLPSGSKFCTNCGNKIGGGITCPKCKADIPAGSKFCPGCGSKFISNCPKCNTELAPGAKFCPGCGAKIE